MCFNQQVEERQNHNVLLGRSKSYNDNLPTGHGTNFKSSDISHGQAC